MSEKLDEILKEFDSVFIGKGFCAEDGFGIQATPQLVMKFISDKFLSLTDENALLKKDADDYNLVRDMYDNMKIQNALLNKEIECWKKVNETYHDKDNQYRKEHDAATVFFNSLVNEARKGGK